MSQKETTNTTNVHIDTGDINSTTDFNEWLEPELIDTVELIDSIELVYKQEPAYTYTTNGFYPLGNPPRIFKVVFSCKDGKWHKSERIEGRYVYPMGEGYEF